MKLWKRSLAMILALMMVLGTFGTALAVETSETKDSTTYQDVAENKYYAEYLEDLTKSGVVKEEGDLFLPDNACTRAVFVTWLWRIAGSPAAKTVCTLSDVKDGQEYTEAVTWAWENGIVKGYYDGTFGIHNAVTRAQMVTFLYRFAKHQEKAGVDQSADLSEYPDVDELPSHAKESMAWAVAVGVLQGTTDGKLNPNGQASRAHAVAFVGRLQEATHEHAWDAGQVTKSATCTRAGVRTYTCTDCGETKTESIAKRGHRWGEWQDNGDGTHIRVCGRNSSHTQSDQHSFVDDACTKCGADRVMTREDLEKAIVDTAWAYYLKGAGVQYDSEAVDTVGKYYGGQYRVTEDAAPEDATSHTDINSVCSDWILKIYLEALNYRMFDVAPLDATTTGMWLFCENQGDPALEESDIDSCLVRWKSSDFQFTNNTSKGHRDLDYGVDKAVYMTDDEAQAFMLDWENNLRPGDVFVAMKGSGHALLYMGNGYVLDCSGDKYDTELGIDQYELFGAVYKLTRVDEVFVNGTCPFFGDGEWVDEDGTLTNFILFRPTEFLVQSDDRVADGSVDSRADAGTDGDLGNDPVIDGYVLPAASKSRVEYPAMTIDRTVEITPFGTASTGEELTYSIKIANRGDENFYTTYNTTYLNAGAGFAPKAYEDLVITETVPAGTTFVSATNGGVENDGTIAWTVDVPVGETVEVTYTVKVTAAVGATIVNDGGFVGNIPSNSISNVVGGAKLSEAALTGLAEFAATSPDDWAEKYNVDPKTAGGSKFAERIYAKAMGLRLELSAVDELVKNLFTYTENKEFLSIVRRYEGTTKTASMFELNAAPAGVYADIQKMMVPNYVGGQKFYTGEAARGTTICEFRNEYLEPGDIIVYVDTDTSGAVTGSRVMVWGPEDTVISITADLKTAVYKGPQAKQLLWKAFVQDLYFVLRPSQAIEDVNENLYDITTEPFYPTEKGTSTLSEANVAKLQALTAGEDIKGAGAKFAYNLYKQQFGIELPALNDSNLNVFAALFTRTDPKVTSTDMERDYVWADHDTELANAVEYWGSGASAAEEDEDGDQDYVWTDGGTKPALSDLEVGDIVLLSNYADKTTKRAHWALVYLGDSKFIFSKNYAYNDAGESNSPTTTYGTLDFSAADGKDPTLNITFAEMMTTDPNTAQVWDFFLVFRLSNLYYDINNPAYEPPAEEISGPVVRGTTSLTQEQLDMLAAMTASDAAGNYMQMATAVYAKLGIDLEGFMKKSVSTISNLYVFRDLFEPDDGKSLTNKNVERDFRLAAPTTDLDYMLIEDFWGAGASAAEEDEDGDNDYVWLATAGTPDFDKLQPGDIIAFADYLTGETNGTSGDSVYWTLVYQGGGKFLASLWYGKGDDYNVVLDFGAEGTGADATLNKQFSEIFVSDHIKGYVWDYYYALRPVQGVYDITNVSYVPELKFGDDAESLNDENKAKLAALTADDAVATATRNAPFAEKIYQQIGLDFSPVTGGNSMLNVMNQIFLIDGENLGNGFEYWYELMFEPAEGKETLHAMVMQPFMGGTHMNTEGLDVVENLSYTDLEVGDVVYMCIRNYSSYWIAVYQGDGKFLVSGYEGKNYAGVIYDGVTTITKGQNYWLQWDAKTADVDFLKQNPTLVAANAAGGDYIQDWQCVVVMRPSRAYADINVEAAMS